MKNVKTVSVYSSEVLSLGLLWYGFHDTSREGDGERVLMYWRFLAITFTSSNNYNYAKEGVNLLLQYHYILSEREVTQLLWVTLSIPEGLLEQISLVTFLWNI